MSNRNELTWKTSSRSSGGACVEVARDGELVHVRHSKDPDGPVLTFGRDVFDAFLAYVEETRGRDR
jgi:hypothetical protein